MSRIRATLLGLALAATTAGAAVANDREVSALTIPAGACSLIQKSAGASVSRNFGNWSLTAPAGPQVSAFLECPLPLTNIRIGGTSATKISKFRVTYQDSDSFLEGVNVRVNLLSFKPDSNGDLSFNDLCELDNNGSGNTSVKFTRATKICNVTLQAGSSYSFQIKLTAGTPFGPTSAAFAGIDFPQ
jgi:hypothetical protein